MNAIDDMVKYYQGNEDNLRDELLCFLVLLNRARPLPEEEMETVLRRIRMFDPLLEEDPWVQEYGGRQKAEGIAEGEARGEARGEAKGEARGESRGKTEGIRQSVELIVQTRFPNLLELVMERVGSVQDPTVLQQILVAMSVAQDESNARRYLQALQGVK